MPRSVFLHPAAMRALRALEPPEARRVKATLARLAEDPFKPRPGADIKRLKGTRGREDLFRVRIGELRVVYSVTKKELLVTDVFRRGAGYEV